MPHSTDKTLYLIPLPIADVEINWSIPLNVIGQIIKIKCFIVENSKTARHFLKRLNPDIKWDEIHVFEMDKHDINAQHSEIDKLLSDYTEIGLMSEAGLPCIADPGNHVVRMAHEQAFKVRPLSGPSSIILALISSGLNGQNFKFNGYLPAKPEERKQAIITLEKACKETTQLFIEAPYRNAAMLSDLLRTLNPETRLLLASDISGANEFIVCRKVSWWRQHPYEAGKIPCMFAIGH